MSEHLFVVTTAAGKPQYEIKGPPGATKEKALQKFKEFTLEQQRALANAKARMAAGSSGKPAFDPDQPFQAAPPGTANPLETCRISAEIFRIGCDAFKFAEPPCIGKRFESGLMHGGDRISGALVTKSPGEAIPSRTSSPTRLLKPAHQRELPAHDFKIGDRVRLSALGKARSPRSIPTGQIVSLVSRKPGYGSVRVLWDGLTAPRRLHASYIELDADGAS